MTSHHGCNLSAAIVEPNAVVTVALAWMTAIGAEFLHVWTISMGVVNWAMRKVVHEVGVKCLLVSLCVCWYVTK